MNGSWKIGRFWVAEGVKCVAVRRAEGGWWAFQVGAGWLPGEGLVADVSGGEGGVRGEGKGREILLQRGLAEDSFRRPRKERELCSGALGSHWGYLKISPTGFRAIWIEALIP